METIINYVKPELVILVIALYFVGVALKNTEKVSDKFIPSILGGVGIALAMVWVFATCTMATYQDALLAIFTAAVQGILCAGCSVYVNQLIKQGVKNE